MSQAGNGPQDSIRLIDLRDRRLQVRVHGSGPAVVLIMGAGVPGVGSWDTIEPDLAAGMSVVTYDRSGLGKSSGAPSAPTAADMAAELHDLLERLPVDPPYLLVGASLGGLIQIVFAAAHPGAVAGMVVLDPPTLSGRAPSAERDRALARMQRLAWTGYLRTPPGRRKMVRLFEGSFGGAIDQEKASFLLDGYTRPRGWRALRFETERMPESITQTRAALASGSLPDVPVTVVSAGLHPDDPVYEPLLRERAEGHQAIAAAFPRGRRIVAEHSTHWITLDQPELVVAAIREVLGEASAG